LRWKQRAEALHERDGTAVRVGDAVGTRTSPLPGKQLAQEHTENLAQQVAVSGEQKPHPTRQRQYPLPVGHDREYVVDEICRGTCHPATRAGRTKSAGLARDATKRSSAHMSQRTRAKPWHSKPQARNFSNRSRIDERLRPYRVLP